jgi:hypothetical protein
MIRLPGLLHKPCAMRMRIVIREYLRGTKLLGLGSAKKIAVTVGKAVKQASPKVKHC